MLKQNSQKADSLNNSQIQYSHTKSFSNLPKEDIFISLGDKSTLASSKYSTINNYSSTGKFNFDSHQALEKMIDDMNYNIINKRRKEFSDNEDEIEQLQNSIGNLNQLIASGNEEKEATERQLYLLQHESNAMKIKLEEVKAINFHNNIEKVFLQKRNGNTQQEIERLEQETRKLSYARFGVVKDNGDYNSESKKKAIEIEALISQKKVLATSIVLMNKKIIDIKKKIGMHMQKGEFVLDLFNNTLQQGK